MENCSANELVEHQAMLKACKKLNDTLLGDVEAGKIAERKVIAEKKQVVTVDGKKQVR